MYKVLRTSDWEVTIKTEDHDTGRPLWLDAVVTLEYDGGPCDIQSFAAFTMENGDSFPMGSLSTFEREQLFEKAQNEFHKFMQDRS